MRTTVMSRKPGHKVTQTQRIRQAAKQETLGHRELAQIVRDLAAVQTEQARAHAELSGIVNKSVEANEALAKSQAELNSKVAEMLPVLRAANGSWETIKFMGKASVALSAIIAFAVYVWSLLHGAGAAPTK